MKRAAAAVLSTLAGLVLLLSYRTVPLTGVASATVAASAGDGTRVVPGTSVSTRWGPVQVAAVLVDGRLTDVQVLQMPASNPRDVQINASAVPRLTAAAVSAGSADIDDVSGATYTSEGYRTSLQAALDAAG